MGSLDDTICAVATPMGEGGVGIVRVSGAQAIRFASKILHLRSGKPLEQIKSYQMHLAQFLWDNFQEYVRLATEEAGRDFLRVLQGLANGKWAEPLPSNTSSSMKANSNDV